MAFEKYKIKRSDYESEEATANRVANRTLFFLETVIVISYIIEMLAGRRSILYVAIIAIISYVPIIVSTIVYNKKKDSNKIKHIVSTGFAIFYIFVLFTGCNDLIFTYVIPMLIVVSLYNNLKFSLTVGISIVVINIMHSVHRIASTENLTSENVTTIEIQILVMIIIVLFFFIVSYTTIMYNKVKVDKINVEKAKISELFSQVMNVSSDLTVNIEGVTSQMEELKDSVDFAMKSMTELNKGTIETAESVQEQLEKTEEIQQSIEKVKNASDSIDTDVNRTMDDVVAGKDDITILKNMSEVSELSGKEVVKTLESFKECTSRMNSITEVIASVASQTSLLSLNASIEAARAGEAGKGFAVVASEISKLAGQTSEATNNIAELINTINEQMQSMVSAIDQLLDNNEKQIEKVDHTAESFNHITERIDTISKQSKEMAEIVKNLSVANGFIVESVETVSAITEEATSHSDETYNCIEKNQKVANEVLIMIENINKSAHELKTMGDK